MRIFKSSGVLIWGLLIFFFSFQSSANLVLESSNSSGDIQEDVTSAVAKLQTRIDELEGMDKKVERILDMLLQQGDEISVLEYRISSSSSRLRKLASTNDNFKDDVGLQHTTVLARIDGLSDNSSQLDSKVSNIAQGLDQATREIQTSRGELKKIDGEVAASEANLLQMIGGVDEALSIRTLYVALCILMLIAVLAFIRRRFSIDSVVMSGKITQAREELDGEYNALDLKLSEMLSKQIEIQSMIGQNSSKIAVDAVDHTLPLKVATEIHRMRKRIASMPDDTKGIKPLTKALERLEESLSDNNYEIIDLLGKNYVDGMVVHQEIVVDDSLSVGEQVITKVVKPQLNHNDKIIQVADVIVSIGE